MPSACGFSFGPFHLDSATRQLRRNGALVPVSVRHFELLLVFVSRPGELLSKDQLIEAAWPDVTVTDNSLAKAIVSLRAMLADGGACEIKTIRTHGYRFSGPVERIERPSREVDLGALLAPHRSFTEGRAALETLERDRITAARATFERILASDPDHAMAHVGMANACALAFEATRAAAAPDSDALHRAAIHAREACGLSPDSGEAWATLGFVLERVGERDEAVAALRKSVRLEPGNWRHQLRLSYGTWGEERVSAAHRTLALLPGCPMAHLLAATVFVARDALAQAEREIDAGLAALDTRTPERFPTVALHWLKGLLLLARGDDEQALTAFERELASEASGHLYARECSANAWYAIGVCRLRRGDCESVRAAFAEAIARVPRHAMAHAGCALTASPEPHDVNAGQSPVDVAIGRAVLRVAMGDVAGAAALVSAALVSAPPGNAGWLVPIDPLLVVHRAHATWAPVLAMLCARAS